MNSGIVIAWIQEYSDYNSIYPSPDSIKRLAKDNVASAVLYNTFSSRCLERIALESLLIAMLLQASFLRL